MPSVSCGKARAGFTLMELMVATAAASVLILSALQLYVQFYGISVRLQVDYRRESREQILQLLNSMPYSQGQRGHSSTR